MRSSVRVANTCRAWRHPLVGKSVYAFFFLLFFLVAFLIMGATASAAPPYDIRDDATGGDCAVIGTWIPETKTCTLTTDITASSSDAITISGDGITLDGNGRTLTGAGSYNGVSIDSRGNFTVRNLTVSGFQTGISADDSHDFTLLGNTLTSNGTGILIIQTSYSSSDALLAGNVFSGNGILVNNSARIAIRDNLLTSSYIGTTYSNGNVISGNILNGSGISLSYTNMVDPSVVSYNSVSNGSGIRLYSAYVTDVYGNTVSNCTQGILLDWGSGNNRIFHNIFAGNQVQASLTYGTGNVFNLPSGGNYWSDWTSPDANGDGIVDAPYVFSGGQDDLPLVAPYQWAAYHIIDNATGGDCPAIGSWDPSSKTCTLDRNVTVTDSDGISLESDQVRLDGNGHILSGNMKGVGVIVSGMNYVTVSRLTVGGFDSGIELKSSQNSILRANTLTMNDYGITLDNTIGSTVTRNTVDRNSYAGFLLTNVATGDIIQGNRITYQTGPGAAGMILSNTNNATIYQNDFIGNNIQAVVSSNSPYNHFNHYEVGYGGNFWSGWTSPDDNHDGFVDNPYIIDTSNQDSEPFAHELNYPLFDAKWRELGGEPWNELDVPRPCESGVAMYQDYANGRLYWNESMGSTTAAVFWVHGAILAKYDAAGRENGPLGLPTGDETAVPGYSGARVSSFTGGRIYWSPGTGTSSVTGTILNRYIAGGGPAYMGMPLGDAYDVPGGKAQNFERAIITWNGTANPAYAVAGGIMYKYRMLGGPTGPYALATSDEMDATGAPGARESRFATGRIYWSMYTGTHGLQGPVFDKFMEVGGPASNGLPTTDAYRASTGWAQNTQMALITWNNSLGAHLVYKGIMGKYLMLGGPNGPYGLATSDEMDAPGAPGARESNFERGRIYWHTSTGTHGLQGPVFDKFEEKGGSAANGLPTTDAYRAYTGWAENTQRAMVTWDNYLGAHLVFGGIMGKYVSLGGPNGMLHMPVSDEYDVPGVVGARESDFQGGRIYWSSTTGVHPVSGGILSRYLAVGGPSSGLGLPVTDEYTIYYFNTTMRRQAFQHGFITWSQFWGTWVDYT